MMINNLHQVMEIGAHADEAIAAKLLLWRSREIVTLTNFFRTFKIKKSNESKYPVIAAVVKHEESLPLIKYAKDILAWHAVLFKVVKPGTITREDAGIIRNRDVIARLPPEEQEQGKSVLNKFCIAFNATITIDSYKGESFVIGDDISETVTALIIYQVIERYCASAPKIFSLTKQLVNWISVVRMDAYLTKL
jgi:hypothetical protein